MRSCLWKSGCVYEGDPVSKSQMVIDDKERFTGSQAGQLQGV